MLASNRMSRAVEKDDRSVAFSGDDRADPSEFLGGVHLDGVVEGLDDLYPVSIFHRPELFESLSPLQVAHLQSGEDPQKRPAVSVYPVVFVVRDRLFPVAVIGDGRPGKVESKVILVEGDLDGIGVAHLFLSPYLVYEGGEVQRRVVQKGPCHLLDLRGDEEGLIPLDVHDDVPIIQSEVVHGLGDPVRPGPVAGGGHDGISPEALHLLEYALVIGGHGDVRHKIEPGGLLIDVLYHGFAADVRQRFPLEAR